MLSKLIESIISDSNKDIGFDLSKSYVSNIAKQKNPDNHLPVVANQSSWEEVNYNGKIFLEKTYKFKDISHIKYFLNEHLSKSEKMNYNPEVYIKGKSVKFYLMTENIDQVTENDIGYSKFLDEIYADIFYLR
jgi:pterin-4a-carbinolamine dehydratase